MSRSTNGQFVSTNPNGSRRVEIDAFLKTHATGFDPAAVELLHEIARKTSRAHITASIEKVSVSHIGKIRSLDGRPAVKVIIAYSRHLREYRVPAPDGSEAGAYYTDDEADARATGADMWKNHKAVEFRVRRKA